MYAYLDDDRAINQTTYSFTIDPAVNVIRVQEPRSRFVRTRTAANLSNRSVGSFAVAESRVENGDAFVVVWIRRSIVDDIRRACRTWHAALSLSLVRTTRDDWNSKRATPFRIFALGRLSKSSGHSLRSGRRSVAASNIRIRRKTSFVVVRKR